MIDENIIRKEPQTEPSSNSAATSSISPISPPEPTSKDVAIHLPIKNIGPTASPSPGGDLSRLGNGERNLSRDSGTKVAEQPSEWERASQRWDEGELKTNSFPLEPDRSPNGKIGHLPYDLRIQINQRLLDGQDSPQILPWLNELPVVKEILRTLFDSQPITKQNLSRWKLNGYQQWLSDRERVSTLQDRCQYAAQINAADAGHLAPAAASAASDKILEFLDHAQPGQIEPDALVKYAAVASALAKTEQNNTRIKIANERLRQREMLILLKRDKDQRDSIAIGLRLLDDARAKQIVNSTATHAEKIELLGLHTYGDLWEPRLVPENNPAS